MITFEDGVRLVRIQERLRSATYHEISKDGHHKSGEGAVTLSFCLPPVVSDERDAYWAVEVYSYLLCPGARSETFIGKSASEAISKAEDAIAKWCFGSEMEQFEQRCGVSSEDHEPCDTCDEDLPR